MKFDYAILSLEDMAKQLKPTDAELRAFYEKSKAQYANSIPGKRKAVYIPIDQAKLPNPPKVTAKICRVTTTPIRNSFGFPNR